MARGLAEAGCQVVIVGSKRGAVDAAGRRSQPARRQGDISSTTSPTRPPSRRWRRAVRERGRIEILVNNAGHIQARTGPELRNGTA